MYKTLCLVCSLFTTSLLFSQDTDIQQYINEGIALHDKGEYEAALEKYDAALAIDKDHYSANYEKSYTLMVLKRYDECIEICKKLLKQDNKHTNAKLVYVNYGSVEDYKGNSNEAIKIYDQGIKAFPDHYLLYYNKGITLMSLKKEEEAAAVIQQGLQHNPLHASAHNALAIINRKENKIASLLATLAFLSVEPQGARAKGNVERMESILNGNVEKTGEKSITISLSPDGLKKKKGKKGDDFGPTEMIISLTSALDFDDKFKDETPVDRLYRKIQVLVNSVGEGGKKEKGFFRKFYGPFFTEMKEKEYLLTYCHIAYASSDDETNAAWLNDNKSSVEEFYQWLKSYKWE